MRERDFKHVVSNYGNFTLGKETIMHRRAL